MSVKELKKGILIDAQAREMAYRVLKLCLEEKNNHKLYFNVEQAWTRATDYTGLSRATLSKILKQGDENNGTFVNLPHRKNKSGSKKYILDVDDFDRHEVHRCIEEFYLEKESVPRITDIHKVIDENFSFPWGKTTLKKMLTQMGYTKQFRHIAEDPSVVAARKQYLEKIREYRNSGRKIYYIDEMWFDHKLPFRKCWRLALRDSIMTDVTAKNRLVLIHAGSKDGFLPGAQWLFEVGVTQGDYQIQMSKENFELWVTKLLIAKLPRRSIVVMDSVSYHNELLNDVPTRTSSKEEMYTWVKNNTDYSIDDIHTIDTETLYSMIDVSKSNCTPKYKIDHILKSNGHDVLRLPPYMGPTFSPIVMAWENIAQLVEQRSAAIEVKDKPLNALNTTRQIIESAISQSKQKDWQVYDERIMAMEEIYWIRDSKMEQVMKRHENLEDQPESNPSDESGDDGIYMEI